MSVKATGERLREEIERLRAALNRTYVTKRFADYWAEIERLRAEIERLQAALQKIAAGQAKPHLIAREALGQKEAADD